MVKPSLEQIATALNPTQRRLIGDLPADGTERHWPDGLRGYVLNHLRGFGRSGLVDARYERSGVYMRLTSNGKHIQAMLGVQARTALKGEGG